jgi:hypothetical protein
MRRVVVFVVGLLVLQATPAGAGEPDVVKVRTCNDGARSRLELTDIGPSRIGRRVRMRFEVHRSPVGHWWRITLTANRPGFLSPNPGVWRPSVASDSGDLAVQVRRWGVSGLVRAKAVDTQTGQVCEVHAVI